MSSDTTTLVHRRTAVDVVLGILIVIAGLVLLGNVVLATAISVLFLGWMVLIAGIAELVTAFLRIRSGGFFSAALTSFQLSIGLCALAFSFSCNHTWFLNILDPW